MKKLLVLVILLGLVSPLVWGEQPAAAQASTSAAQGVTPKKAFKARRKQIKQLLKQYKKAPATQKPALKAQLAQVVGVQVDAQLEYMKAHIAAERANLDNWETKIRTDEQNLEAVKARRMEELISGEAQKKHKAAKKAWKQQLKKVK